MVSRDYEELFNILNGHKVKYLVIGAHAVIFYTEPRFTKDIDIWIPPELNQPERVYQALKTFGAPLIDVAVEDFDNKRMILQIGIAPVRVDILMHVKGVSAWTAWKNRVRSQYGKTTIQILGLKDLIKVKKKSGRPQDRLDLEKLVDRCFRKNRRRNSG
ncbi:MAG: nucleotidyltransferase [Candidatus Omnitrophica bacterium]|nr:nucleotidyltransferase [Candidatus Omnitrophota bacterium]